MQRHDLGLDTQSFRCPVARWPPESPTRSRKMATAGIQTVSVCSLQTVSVSPRFLSDAKAHYIGFTVATVTEGIKTTNLVTHERVDSLLRMASGLPNSNFPSVQVFFRSPRLQHPVRYTISPWLSGSAGVSVFVLVSYFVFSCYASVRLSNHVGGGGRLKTTTAASTHFSACHTPYHVHACTGGVITAHASSERQRVLVAG